MSLIEPLPDLSRAESERLDVESGTSAKRIWVTWTIVALNVLVYVLMIGKGADFRHIDLHTLIVFGGNFGPDTLNGEVWRLVIASFVHQNLKHIFWNMVVLGFAGAVVEREYGSARFSALYLFAALTGNLTSLCLHYWVCSEGASGAIFGVIGALLAYVARFLSTMDKMARAKYFNIGVWLVIYCLCAGHSQPRVDAAGHLGGLLGGFVMGWILGRPRSGVYTRPSMFHTPAFAWAIAAITIFGLGLQALHETASLDAQKLLAFARMEERASVIDTRLNAEMKLLKSMTDVPGRRNEFSTLVHNSVWPEWNELFNMFANAPLPEGSSLMAARNAEMRYFDDMRRAVSLMADIATDKKVADAAFSLRVQKLLTNPAQRR
ncbi:MAG: rhomboid family intramembrane serine protease [Paraburkholderia sp.]|uniref:rhomboid family intramembrane serine protease n=1 Tax=Paraburkholderia sp. TaxID=1926495 RepID=UPI003C626FF7